MNKIFKVVWSKVKHCYVVVSEIAKNTTSGGARRCRMGKVSLAAAMAAAVLTSSFAMPNSAWAAEIVTATMQNYIAIKGVDSVGDDTSIYEDYQKDRFGDYIYDTNGNKIIDWNSILSVDSTKEIDGYNYILRKIDSPNNDGYYWVREGYDIKIINNDKYFLGAQVNYKVSPYATVSNPSSDNLAFAARNGIVDTEDKTAVNNDILHKLTYTNYVAGTNGGIDVPEGWNYYIYRDDQNGVKRAVDVGINLNENFKEVTYNNETGHYQFNGEDVQFENVYAITLGKDTSPTIGVFLTSENGNEVYTGPVYGLNNEILVTAYDSQSKTWSTVWGVEMPDPNASIASMTVGQFQDVLDDIHAEDVILSNADIEKTVVNGTNGNGTINLQNKKGNVVPGIEISRSAVQGQNTVITISDADNGTISLETGSRVVANGGETYDSTNNTLETISINGNEYRIAAGGGTGTMSSWTAKVGKDKAIIGNGVELEFKGAGDASVSLNGNTITISATDTNRYTTGVTAVKSGKTITTSYSQEGNNATNFDGINFKEGSNVTLGLEGRTITVNADNYYVTGVSTNKSSDNSVDVKISTNNPIKGYDEYKIGFVQGNDNVEIDVDENGKIKISTQDENNFTVAAEYDSNTKKINFYRDNANKQNPDYFVELDNVATTGDITNLQNKGIKEIGIANNTISLIRNDNSNTVVDGSLIFGTGGGEKENGEYVDTYVTIGQEGKLDAIKLNTGSLVRGEGKVVAGSGENKSLSKITINGEVFNVPLVVPNATAGENGETTYTLEYLDINGKTYKVAQSIQGEGHDWGLTGEVGKDDEKNTAGTPVGWQSSSYTVPGDGEVKLNMLNRTTGEVQEDQIVIKDVASATKLANEVSRAQGVEAQLSQAITDEVAAREANDAALSEMITAETNRATAAEEALGNAINAETARAQEVEAQLSQAITDETARAQGVEAQLSQAITDEAAARKANDAALSDMITAEANRAAAAEAALGDAINAETARAQGVEAQLSEAITNEAAERFANDIVSGAINSQNGSISLTKNNGETITLDGEICDSRLDNVSFDASTGKMTFTVKDHYNNDVQNSIVVSDIASKTALEKEVSDRIAVDNYLYETMNKNDQYLDSKINHLGSKVNKVGAGAAALAALHPMDFDPDDKLSFAVGAGNYAGETATALGAFYRPNEKVMMNVAGTYGNGENMVNMGVSFALDRTNNVSNSRTAMAREIVDLREQVATQGQQIAQLVALVNQLTGVKEPVAPTVQPFPDVPANHWAYEYLNNLVAMGVIEGYPDGTFGGDRTMTRYEFATMLFKAMQNGAVLSEQIRQEFNAELGRIRVDRIKGADDDANKIERVRVNNYEDRDDYGSKIVMVSAGK